MFVECSWTLNTDASNTDGGTESRIYLDLEFKCYGQITGWEIRTQQAGQIYVDVYKPNPAISGAYILMSKYLITSPGAGKHTFNIKKEDWMEVFPGYVLGSHFTAVDSPGIVNQMSSANSLAGMPFTADQLSQMYVSTLYDSDLPLGISHNGSISAVRAIPNIKPHVRKGRYTCMNSNPDTEDSILNSSSHPVSSVIC